nr:hypothetical protein [Flammeovirgaceae bacterium]
MFDFSNITDEGITIALVGYFIVFASLVVLFLVFNNLPRLLNILLKPSKSKIVEKHEPIKKRQA